MPFELVWSPKIQEKFKKLDKEISAKIIKKIFSIQDNPVPYLKKLKEVPCWRLRVGDYRVIISLDLVDQKIILLNLGHRKNIYQE